MRKILLSLAIILMIGMLAACSEDDDNSKEENDEDSITAVETGEVSKGDLEIEKSFYGRTEPNQSTPVMLETPGEVDSLEVAEGDEVKEDDLIAKLKSPAGVQNIRAPKDGTVINLDVNEGDMVSDEDPLAIVADMKTMKLSFDVTASDRSLFKKDDKRTVRLDDEEYEAKIEKVGTMPGETGLLSVTAKIDNEDETILPGSVAKINVPTKRIKDSLIVPTEAIVEDEGEAIIYMVNDNKVTKKVVDIEESQTDKTAIDADVKKGDQVVVKGQLTLSDDSEVNVVETGE